MVVAGGCDALPALVVPAALQFGLEFADAARVDLDVVEPHLTAQSVAADVVHHGVGVRALLLAPALAVYPLVEEQARPAQHTLVARLLVERLLPVQPVLRTCIEQT